MADRQTEHYQSLRQTAASYLPEWSCDPSAPDAGTAAAMLIEDMRADSEHRLGQVLAKHRALYLNLFDRLRAHPAQSAAGYVQFVPVPGVTEPVQVPAGTQLLAENEHGDSDMTFETIHGITAVTAQMDTVYETDRDSDRILCLRGKQASAQEAFCLFDFQGKNMASHALYLAFDDALDAFAAPCIGLRISTPNAAEAPAAARRLAQIGSFSLLCPAEDEKNTDFEFSAPRCEENILWLDCTGLSPRKTMRNGQEQYVICVRAAVPDSLAISGVQLLLSQENVSPDAIVCKDVLQSAHRFLPFGRPLELYAECGIESAAVFARRGAQVEMRFNISFEQEEQLLAQPEENIDYKIIMRKKPAPLKVPVIDVKPDEVALEYCSTTGWKPLIEQENAKLLFNGSATGEVALSFTCPDDMVKDAADAGGCRLRLRLVRAEGLYRLPCRVHCPVMEKLRFSYHYERTAVSPDAAIQENNYRQTDLRPFWEAGRAVPLYVTAEADRPCLYLGFDGSPAGSPLSLYFEIENSEDAALEFTAEYSGPRGFVPIQTADHTEKMRYSGTLLLLVPTDCTSSVLFGQKRYWLRLVSSRAASKLACHPLVRQMQLNLARAENRRTRSELFYVDDADAALRCSLAEKGLLRITVWVNEANQTDFEADHWVLWTRRAAAAEQGRYVTVDEENGTVTFEKGSFARYPVQQGAPAVRVNYESYAGAAGNLPERVISTMAQPLKYISHVTNPMPMCGGYDSFGEDAAARLVYTMLRTRGRAVSRQDYFDSICEACSGVRRIQCALNTDRAGNFMPKTVTIAVLTDPYDPGGHLFSAVKERIRTHLEQTGGLVPVGKTLLLVQPRFIRVSVRLWLACSAMDSVYELQAAVLSEISAFLDPLCGGFDQKGWEIGKLPTPRQLLAFLKLRRPDLSVTQLSMVAAVGGSETAMHDEETTADHGPFDMAVNGDHVVYVQIRA